MYLLLLLAVIVIALAVAMPRGGRRWGDSYRLGGRRRGRPGLRSGARGERNVLGMVFVITVVLVLVVGMTVGVAAR